MKKIVPFVFIFISAFMFSQAKSLKKKPVKKSTSTSKKTTVSKSNPNLVVLNQDVPLLIPHKKDGKFGYVNQKGKFIVQPEYHIALFFAEDCNLLTSKNEKIRKFGGKEYATVEKDFISYRINLSGKRVYKYKDDDLGRCKLEYKPQLFHAYTMNKLYGVIEDSKFVNNGDSKQYQIYPQYEYLFIMEGNDLKNPMIVASQNDMFGVIDINNKIVVPFEYSDIKRNFSWKLGKMFEVTKDGENYYYIDANNKSY